MPRAWASFGTAGIQGSAGSPGGDQTLDDVCDLGNITDQDLKFGNGYINYGGPDGDSYLQWYDSAVDGGYSYLKWDQGDERHEFSHGLNIIGDLLCNYQTCVRVRTTGPYIYMNYDGGESDCKIFFYEGGSAEGAYLRWNDSGGNFHLTHGLTLDTGNIIVNGAIAGYGDLHLNIDYGAVDSIIYFYRASPLTETLRWDYADNRFQFSAALKVDGRVHTDGHVYVGGVGDGAVILNAAAADIDARIVFQKPSSGYEELKWNKTSSRFQFTNGLYVEGNFHTEGNIGLNVDQGDVDAKLEFYKPGSGNEILKWNKTNTRFEFSNELSMESHKIVSVTDPTSDQDAATKKYVDDTGGDTGPILIMNAMWLDDDEGAPLTSRLSGTYPTLHDGDKTTEAKYNVDKWSIGVDLGVTRNVARIKLFDDPADQNHPADTGSGWGGIYPSGNYDSLEIYTADMNGAWTLRETVHPVPRLPTGHGNPCTIDIELSGTYSTRFIKLHCHLGELSAVNGGAIGMAEIECHYD